MDKRFKDNSKDIFIDGFTQQLKKEDIVVVPDYLFFSNAPRNIDLNNTFHTKGKKYEVHGLIDILSRYKFTIEENTPIEEEVALDPELLGKVFENLLACYEEGDDISTRKQTGSFYTPREIVNYMVDESLITYLSNSLLEVGTNKNKEEINEKLHHLFSYTSDEPILNDFEKGQLIDSIDNCKILDPACGSGAFPMGVLHKLVFVLAKLDPKNIKWKQKQIDKVVKLIEGAESISDSLIKENVIAGLENSKNRIGSDFDNNELDFGRKLFLIENCIYGSDIQPVAVQIAKLRCFIALIVEQKANITKENNGVRPLPNLETKFVAANSLIELQKPKLTTGNIFLSDFYEKIRLKKEQLKKVRHDHFEARTPSKKEKCREDDLIIRQELTELLIQNHDFQPETAK